MKLIITDKQTRYMSGIVSLSFLCIHIAMFALFFLCGVTPMVVFNVFSVLFYLGSFALIHREKLYAYVISVYLEVVAHMTLAVVCVGWDAGFQTSLLGMCLMAFFSEYFSKAATGMRHVSGLRLSIVAMCAYMGSLLYVHFHPAPYVLPAGVEFWLQIAWGLVVFTINISYLKLFVMVALESEKVMEVQLSHDELTGLPNRYHMSDYLGDLEKNEALAGHWAAMIDIDDFKQVNDTYGHNCGDYVLSEVASLLEGGDGSCELCRWGGEEFLMVGEVGDDTVASYACLENLRKAVAEHRFWYEDQRLSLTVTIGAAPYAGDMSISEWISAADAQLYAGKHAGKNQVVTV